MTKKEARLFNSFLLSFHLCRMSPDKKAHCNRIVHFMCVPNIFLPFHLPLTIWQKFLCTFYDLVSFVESIQTPFSAKPPKYPFSSCYWMFLIVVLKIGCVLLLFLAQSIVFWKLLVSKVYSSFSFYHTCS